MSHIQEDLYYHLGRIIVLLLQSLQVPVIFGNITLTIEESSKLNHASKVDNNHKCISNAWKKTQTYQKRRYFEEKMAQRRKYWLKATQTLKRGKYPGMQQGEATCKTSQLTTDMLPQSLFSQWKSCPSAARLYDPRSLAKINDCLQILT